MKKLILHVGHSKTGTSYLQSVFALNRTLLEQNDITYPSHKDDIKAVNGHLTDGNASGINLRQNFSFNTNTLFFSNENLYNKLLHGKVLKFLSKRYDLEVVLYIRNPMEYFTSHWGHWVKRYGCSLDVDSYLKDRISIKDYAHRFLSWVKLSEELKFTLKVRNYSVNKNSIVEDFFTHFLNAEHVVKNLSLPENKKVNRSLSNSEYEILRLLNTVYDNSLVRSLTNILMEQYPDIEPLKVKIKQSTYDFIKINEYLVDKINEHVDEDQRIVFGKAEDWVGQGNTLDNEVIQTLGDFIKSKVNL